MELAIFPLNGAVLFPGTNLPLNIFENRYIEMINFALSKDRCIGMIQTTEKSKLYNVGCIGKINSFNETSDGRYLISLQGLSCFKVIKEIKKKYKFRMIKAEILDNHKEEVFTKDEKFNILKKYKRYIKSKEINIDLTEIEKIDLEQLIKFIAMVSPFKNIEKQMLLESLNQRDFYLKLESIIDLEIFDELDNKSIN